MESLNRMAIELVDEAIDFAEVLDIGAYELENEATVLDFGVDFRGGVEAGVLLAEIQTGGLATVQSRMGEVAGAPMRYVDVTTDHPELALLCSQKAGWEVSVEDFEGLGSGPARALVGTEDVFQRVGYHDAFDLTVLTIEADALPGEAVAEHVADLTETNTSSVFLAGFRTASLAGSISIGARAAELAAFRLSELGYDPLDLVSVSGTAPVAPVAPSEEEAMARTNDALAYGGQVTLTVEEDFDRFDEVVSTANDQYGEPFAEIFEEIDWDFHELDESVFAPAQITVDVLGGPTHVFGETDEELLAESFGL
ncbi:methenyltetrahydromethanopterin cyclohydrolase [Haloarchaeobius sp. DYHT-AS-18]|uniref:methenyltetrahydromethanopterin cyclohydrolase n=1 Tax=Haloarchaeobius sp. DYHT-AS-18 TaxID=3446117 RepID=UPI003EC06571